MMGPTQQEIRTQIIEGRRADLAPFVEQIEAAAQAAVEGLRVHRHDLVQKPQAVYSDGEVARMRRKMPGGLDGAMAFCSVLERLLSEGVEVQTRADADELTQEALARPGALVEGRDREGEYRDARQAQIEREGWPPKEAKTTQLKDASFPDPPPDEMDELL